MMKYTLALFYLLGMMLVSGCTLTTTEADAQPIYEGEPIVKIASPLENDTYQQGVAVNILARIENAGADIARVDIYRGNELLGSAENPNTGGAPAFTITNSWLANEFGNQTLTVLAVREDNSISGSASVRLVVLAAVVQVVEEPAEAIVTDDTQATTETSTDQASVETPIQQPTTNAQTVQTVPTTAPLPTAAPTEAPTSPPAPPTASRPQVRVLQGANVRSGPGIIFNPPIGSLAGGATANVTAISTDRQWYKIEYYNGFGWVSAQTVEAVGDISSLPVDAGPPPPAPTAIPATPVPAATQPPAANIDLSITNLVIAPLPLVCSQPSTITVTIVNTGTSASPETAVIAQNLYNGNVNSTANATVRALGTNESADVTLTLTISTNFEEDQTIRVIVDPNNAVAETDENNNSRSQVYKLARGGC